MLMCQVPSSIDEGSPRPDELRMVKKFRRPAAGIEEQIPSDLRPPLVLQKTLDYLINEVIGNTEDLEKVHHFVWDRTRGIRNDFSVQHVKEASQVRIAINCFERIVRFHILSRHQVGGHLQERSAQYDHQQDLEQCVKTLVSLMAYYDSVHQRYRSPNEAEFRAYWIITRIPEKPEADVQSKVQNWPPYLLNHPRVRTALDIYNAASTAIHPRTATQVVAQQNYMRFWNLIKSPRTSYLMACCAEIFFDLVRKPALWSIAQAYHRGRGRVVDEWTMRELAVPLGLDNEDEAAEYVYAHGLDAVQRPDSQWFLDVSNARSIPFTRVAYAAPPRIQFFSRSLVEPKRFRRSFPAVLNGVGVGEARRRGMVEETLFVSDDEAESEVASAPSSTPEVEAVAPPAFAQPAFAQPAFAPPAFAPPAFAQPAFAPPTFVPAGVCSTGVYPAGICPAGVCPSASDCPDAAGRPSAGDRPGAASHHDAAGRHNAAEGGCPGVPFREAGSGGPGVCPDAAAQDAGVRFCDA